MQIFNNLQFGEIRTATIDNEPYFVANDLCKALGYSNPRDAVIRHIDEADVVKHDTSKPIISHGINTGKTKSVAVTCVNESGMYSLIFGSKLPQARKFKRWVTSEVLPSIRKHGGYLTTQTTEKLLNDPDALIQLAQNLKREREEKDRARSSIYSSAPKGCNETRHP